MPHRPANRRPFAAALLLALAAAPAFADTVGLADLGVDKVEQDFGKPAADKSIRGNPLTINGTAYARGLGTHASSVLYVDLDAAASRFTAAVGVDDEIKNEPARLRVRFSVHGDGRVLWQGEPQRVGEPAQSCDADLTGVKQMALVVDAVDGAITSAHADWADATITYAGRRPTTGGPPKETAEVLTPPPAPTPRINSAGAFGVRPGKPILYTVVASGEKPMAFAADGLPPGATLDPATGVIGGRVDTAGTYAVTLKATNARGSAEKKLSLVVGNDLALTPPMGWNSWNCFAQAVSQEKVKAAADALVASGLTDYGWTYVNIDDCWQLRENRSAFDRRTADGRIRTNDKFPEMKALVDYIHSKGLKAGIYSSPGPATCGGYEGSYGHEADDARQWAEWGFDYVKYDWCAYQRIATKRKPDFDHERDIAECRLPYETMQAALAKQDRDIVYSLCQYGWGRVWEWGANVDGQLWRTTDDINDSWGSMAGIGFSQTHQGKYAKPGRWNDPDMLVVGHVGWGPNLHPTRLTPNEQYTHVTLWSLLSAPLLIGCDLTRLDPFTFNLLANAEVIDVNQDVLGKQATRVWQQGSLEAWAKPLSDGGTAVGLFNRGPMATKVSVKLTDLGLAGPMNVRDVWRQQDKGTADAIDAPLARHGCVLLKLTTAK